MSALTRSQIIGLAIKQAGSDLSVVPLAEIWLDNILDRLYEDHKWPFQEKRDSSITITTGQSSVSFPSDFLDLWNRHGLKLVDSDGKQISLTVRDTDFLDLIPDINVMGPPESAVVDLNSRTWRPYPLPNQNYGVSLRYKYKPQRLTDIGGDPKPVFPNDQLLVEAVFTTILQYDDDERAIQDLSFLDALVRRYKHGFNKSPMKNDRVQLSSDVFKPIFPLR